MRFWRRLNKFLRECAVNKFIKFVIVLLGLAVLYLLAGTIAKIEYPVKHEVLVSKYAQEYELSENFVYAVMKAESNFNHEAKSGKNASGLMQIMEPTGEWIAEKLGMKDFSKEQLLTPETNIEMGCFYLSYLLDMYGGDKKRALAAYNAGHANVDSWLLNKKYSKDGVGLDVIPYPETEKYVNLVLKNEKIYNYLYEK